MKFDEAFNLMSKGKVLRCRGKDSTKYTIKDGTLVLFIPEVNKLSKLVYFLERPLKVSDPTTLFVKDLLSETWEVVE